jgi:hypothetical protein
MEENSLVQLIPVRKEPSSNSDGIQVEGAVTASL